MLVPLAPPAPTFVAPAAVPLLLPVAPVEVEVEVPPLVGPAMVLAAALVVLAPVPFVLVVPTVAFPLELLPQPQASQKMTDRGKYRDWGM